MTSNTIRLVKGKPSGSDLGEIEKKAIKRRNMKNTHATSRKALIAVERLKEALLISVVLDETGDVSFVWTEEIVNELLAGIKDPGPKRKRTS